MSINVSVHLWRGDPAEVRAAANGSGCHLEMQTFTEDGWPAGELTLFFRSSGALFALGDLICEEAERLMQEEEEREQERPTMVAF